MDDDYDPGAAFTDAECTLLRCPPPVLPAPPPPPVAPVLPAPPPPPVALLLPAPPPLLAASSPPAKLLLEDVADAPSELAEDDDGTTESIVSASTNRSAARKRARLDPTAAAPRSALSRRAGFRGSYNEAASAAAAELPSSGDSVSPAALSAAADDAFVEAEDDDDEDDDDAYHPRQVYGVCANPSKVAVREWFDKGITGRVGGYPASAGAAPHAAPAAAAAAAAAPAPTPLMSAPPESLSFAPEPPYLKHQLEGGRGAQPAEPQPPLHDSVKSRTYDFALVNPLGYTGVPLHLIECSADVIVVDSPLGRSAVARIPIPKGQVLGYYEGLRVRGDPVTDLHVSREGRGRGGSSLLRSPPSCFIVSRCRRACSLTPRTPRASAGGPRREKASRSLLSQRRTCVSLGRPCSGRRILMTDEVRDAVSSRTASLDTQISSSVGSGRPANVKRFSVRRRLTEGGPLIDWPSCEAISPIAAGMPLLCDYGDDYWEVVAQRRRVFATLVLQARAMGELHNIGAAVEVSCGQQSPCCQPFSPPLLASL